MTMSNQMLLPTTFNVFQSEVLLALAKFQTFHVFKTVIKFQVRFETSYESMASTGTRN